MFTVMYRLLSLLHERVKGIAEASKESTALLHTIKLMARVLTNLSHENGELLVTG